VSKDPHRLLHENGLQVTAQRLAVLRAVARRPHCTAENVAEAVRAEIGAISRQAVYDALGLLTEKRLLRRIQLAGSPALYEIQHGDDHHHAVCRNCGKTVDVACTVGEASRRAAAAESGYRIHDAEVVYWGTCAECLAEAEED
jgi:Fur family ferric uptake transcriptional regulator